MKLPKASDAVVALFGDAVPVDAPGVQRRQMFGYPAAFVNGNLFMSVYRDDVVLRLGEADRAELADIGGRGFEPMPGRPMTGYMLVPPAVRDDRSALVDWVDRALAFGAELPPKAAKPKAAKR
jgi:TfoX/Sxy family transcriptional regulator of competence genes